ncbi:hypothetical protein [Arthrobacter sp. PM3]|uniref:hypothetical protein n=1 Tax=Arthrobacter sp. PM3 TaxID=2017685 RepID=UPI000E10EA0A|nr:hypothetical protein [Arthrobacter sp. PM3]AXJ09944.1 hypothetical protein CFN17_10140 [Arthrobacter sp. PM3]
MENNQELQANFQQEFQAGGGVAPDDGAPYFEVTYLDPDSGRIRTESFDDAGAADRFASRCVAGEDGWAVIDVVPARVRRAAA